MDFRVEVGFMRNIKIQKLRRRCGADGVLSLFCLWGYFADNAPRGMADNMTDEDIELAAMWNGEHGKFADALTSLQLIDRNEDSVSIHDWEKHQPWVVQREDRREACREAGRRGGLAKARAKQANPSENVASATKNPSETVALASENVASATKNPSSQPSPAQPSPAQPSLAQRIHNAREGRAPETNDLRTPESGENDDAKTPSVIVIPDAQQTTQNGPGKGHSRGNTFEDAYAENPDLDALAATVRKIYPKDRAKCPELRVCKSLLREHLKKEDYEAFLAGLRQWLTDEDWANKYATKLKNFLANEEWRSPPREENSNRAGPITKKGKDLQEMIARIAAQAPGGR